MHIYDHHIIDGPYNSYHIAVSPNMIEGALRQKDMTVEKLKELWELDIKDATKAFNVAVSTITAEKARKKAEEQKRNKDNDAAWNLVKGLITALAPDDETKDTFHEHEDDFHDLFMEMAKAFDNVLRNNRSDNLTSDSQRISYPDPRVDAAPATISCSLGGQDNTPRVAIKQDGDYTTAVFTAPSDNESSAIMTSNKEYLHEWLRKHGIT